MIFSASDVASYLEVGGLSSPLVEGVLFLPWVEVEVLFLPWVEVEVLFLPWVEVVGLSSPLVGGVLFLPWVEVVGLSSPLVEVAGVGVGVVSPPC